MTSSDAHQELVAMIAQAQFAALLRGAEAWARLDITMPQLKVLMLLGLYRSAPVSWLATRMHVSPPNVTGILDRLEQHGWVRRTSDPHDRRVVRVVLAEQGEVFLADLQSAGEERVRALVSAMSDPDQAALRQGLASLLAVIVSQQEREAPQPVTSGNG